MKEKFLTILSSVKREGIDKLIKFLNDSSFFDDPASSNEHNAFKSGLVKHSLAVYEILDSYRKIHPDLEKLEESIKIIGLLHDFSWTGTFQSVTKNIPLKNPDGKNKKRDDGRIVFVEEERFDFIPESIPPYPHGQLSCLMLKQYIKLTKLEDLAINWHHNSQDYQNSIINRSTHRRLTNMVSTS